MVKNVKKVPKMLKLCQKIDKQVYKCQQNFKKHKNVEKNRIF